MKNMSCFRNSLIVILCCTVVCMGIGFIVLSLELKKERNKEKSFDVVFVKVEKTSSVKGSNKDPDGTITIVDDGLSLNMEFQLHAIHDELTYVATIRNDGTIPASIVGLTESPNYSEERFQKLISPISITLSDIQGKELPPGGETTLKIIVYYPPSGAESIPKTIPYRIGLLTKTAK